MFTFVALIYIGWAYTWWLALALAAIILQETHAINDHFKALEVLMRKLAYDPPFKDINTLTQEQKDAHDEYWRPTPPPSRPLREGIEKGGSNPRPTTVRPPTAPGAQTPRPPSNAWFACPGCSYPTARGQYCGHPQCTKIRQ
jgi:hypothetical protein